MRHALGARSNRHVFSDSAIRSLARVYVDDWGVIAGTIGAEYVPSVLTFGESTCPRSFEGMDSRAPRFISRHCKERLRYMTANRQLSPFVDAFGGLRVSYQGSFASFVKEVRVDLKAEGFVFRIFRLSAPLVDPHGAHVGARAGGLVLMRRHLARIAALAALAGLGAACRSGLDRKGPAALARRGVFSVPRPAGAHNCGAFACHGDAKRYFHMFARDRLPPGAARRSSATRLCAPRSGRLISTRRARW